jgi:hypothetical protein
LIPRWLDVQEPWDPLDNDGEEEPFDGFVSVVIVISCLHR